MSRYTLLENDIVYAVTNVSEILEFEVEEVC